MACRETVFRIIDRETGEKIHEIRTTHQGSQLNRCRAGVYAKVDMMRFRVEEEHDA